MAIPKLVMKGGDPVKVVEIAGCPLHVTEGCGPAAQ